LLIVICEVLQSVYPCYCLSVCSHMSNIRCPNFANFFVHVNCGHGSVLLWWQWGGATQPSAHILSSPPTGDWL